MAESTQTQEAKTEAANADTPEFLLTKTGVVLLGAERLGDKLAGLICKLVEKGLDSGVAVLEFRTDNYPKEADGEPVFGMAFADTHSAAINLEHCWHMACKEAAKGEQHLNMLGMLWINILSAVGHELDHLIAATDREMYELSRADEDGMKEMEKSAHDRAKGWIIELAREYNIEMPTPDEFGWFGAKIMGLFTADGTKDLDWVKALRSQMEENIVYDEGTPEKVIKSMRQFIQMSHASDEDWSEQGVVFANLEEQLDLGEKAIHTDAPAAVEVAEETVQEEPVEMVADKASGMFVGAGTGEEAITVADDEAAPAADTVVVENPVDAATAGMMAAAAGVQASLPGMEEVPLPQPVVEEQAVIANAAATATPPPQTQATTYTPNDVDPSIMPAIMETLWKTLYHHIFTKCGWSHNPQTGKFYFANAAAVLEGVNIQHIISHFGCENFIMEYDTLNAAGQFSPEQCQGMIRGHLTSKQGLPCYTVYFNIGGRRIKRVFVAQNPEKMNAQNAYSNTAVEAQQGHMIAWVYKGEAADNAPFKEKCAVKMKDNNYEVIG